MIARDWNVFAYTLGRRFASMKDGETFTIEGPPDDLDNPESGSQRYIQFCCFDGGQSIRCEVVSNSYLPEGLKHSVEDLVTLRMAGWSLPTVLPGEDEGSGSTNLFLDVEVGAAAVAIEAVWVAMRDVWSAEPWTDTTGCVAPTATRCFQLPTPPTDETASI